VVLEGSKGLVDRELGNGLEGVGESLLREMVLEGSKGLEDRELGSGMEGVGESWVRESERSRSRAGVGDRRERLGGTLMFSSSWSLEGWDRLGDGEARFEGFGPFNCVPVDCLLPTPAAAICLVGPFF